MATSDDSSRALWRASGLGVELVGSILGAALVGWLIDKGFGTAPWGVVIGLIVGVVGGGLNFVRAALKMNRDAAAAYRRRQEGRDRGPPVDLPPPTPRQPGRGDARGLFQSEPGDPKADEVEYDFPDDFNKY